MNDRIGDVSCDAATDMPRARSDAAPAKCEKRTAGKSALCESMRPTAKDRCSTRSQMFCNLATFAALVRLGRRLFAVSLDDAEDGVLADAEVTGNPAIAATFLDGRKNLGRELV